MLRALATTAAAALLAIATPVSAAALNVDEATYPGAAGDYNNLLLTPPGFIFDLDGGLNVFKGLFGTPGDGGDTIAVRLDPTETLTRISVNFATNATMFNPVAINQGTRLVFDYLDSNSPTPLVSLAITGRPDGPVTFQTGPLALVGGQFNTTLLTEVLALNTNNGRVGYEIIFDVTAAPAPVPEPATYALMLAGLGLLGGLALRRRA